MAKMARRAREIQAQIGLLEVTLQAAETWTNEQGTQITLPGRGPDGKFRKGSASTTPGSLPDKASKEGPRAPTADDKLTFVSAPEALAKAAKKNAEASKAAADKEKGDLAEGLSESVGKAKKQRNVYADAMTEISSAISNARADIEAFLAAHSPEGIARKKAKAAEEANQEIDRQNAENAKLVAPLVPRQIQHVNGELKGLDKVLEDVYAQAEQAKKSLKSGRDAAITKLDTMTSPEVDAAMGDLKSAGENLGKAAGKTASRIDNAMQNAKEFMGTLTPSAIAETKRGAEEDAATFNKQTMESWESKGGVPLALPEETKAEDFMSGLEKLMDKVYGGLEQAKSAAGKAVASANELRKTVSDEIGKKAAMLGELGKTAYDQTVAGAQIASEAIFNAPDNIGKASKELMRKTKNSPHALLSGIDAMADSLRESNPEVLEEIEKYKGEVLPDIIAEMKEKGDIFSPIDSRRGYAKAMALRKQQVLQAIREAGAAVKLGMGSDIMQQVEGEIRDVIDIA